MSNNNDIPTVAPLKVFPNPTNELVTIEFDQPQDEISVHVTDPTGKVIDVLFRENKSNVQVELDGAAGIYLLEIKTSEGILTTKRVVLDR